MITKNMRIYNFTSDSLYLMKHYDDENIRCMEWYYLFGSIPYKMKYFKKHVSVKAEPKKHVY